MTTYCSGDHCANPTQTFTDSGRTERGILFTLEILHINDSFFCPASFGKAKGFLVKAEYEESEGLGYSSKNVFDFVQNGGTFKLTTFPDYAQYMVRKSGRGRGRRQTNK
jgi:hypothetical protein